MKTWTVTSTWTITKLRTTACSWWIHSSSQLSGHTAAGKTNGWKHASIYQNEMMPGVAANPAKQHTFLLCLQGQLFRASHSASQQLWPNEINISIILYKYICPCTSDFHWFPLSLKLVLKEKRMKNDNFTSWRQFSLCWSAGLNQKKYNTNSNIHPKSSG